MADPQQRDLVLPPMTFAHVLDRSKGNINTLVGPTKTPMSDQERPVRFNPQTRKFEEISFDQAVQPFYFAAEGHYIVLENPASAGNPKMMHPTNGNSNNTPELDFGRKIHIQGPFNLPLWPGQSCEVIQGHSLRSNQYLLCRVYNGEAAQHNWGQQTIAPQTPAIATDDKDKQPAIKSAQNAKAAFEIDPATLVTGKLFIVKGTTVSFFIPPTGVEVLKSERGEASGKTFVREANTLEALEYSILVNESGTKRYEKGPAVVFPEPTETFLTRTNSEGKETRRFRALDLSKLQGIYVQVIQPYNDDETPTDPEVRKAKGLPEKSKPDHKIGDELFITGKDQPIYYPNSNHAIIKYGEQERHNAVAIPKGEGRYVLNRMTGDIKLVKGPHMLLADPITDVIVRRILSPKQVDLWFPGNAEAKAYNESLAAVAQDADVASQTFVSDTAIRSRSMRGATTRGLAAGGGLEALESYGTPLAASAAPAQFGNQVQRGTSYTPPRMVTLDTKYDGAVNISPYTGFAVSVVSKTGERTVVVGPATHLLEYDQTLDVVSLSRGTPKDHDTLTQTVYLQVKNNRVTEQYEVETKDMVKVTIKMSCRLNFEGEPAKWFSVDNYVKLLTQNIRSRLSAAVKAHEIGEFYNSAIQIVRDTILGPDVEDGDRKGLLFNENGMRVYDVEVLSVTIADPNIQKMLADASVETFRSNIEITGLRRQLDATKTKETISQSIAEAKAATERKTIELQIEKIVADFAKTVKEKQNAIELLAKEQDAEKARQEAEDAKQTATLARTKRQREHDLALERTSADQRLALARADADQKLALDSARAEFERTVAEAKQTAELAFLTAETASVVERIKGIEGPLGDVLLALSSQETMRLMTEAAAPMNLLGGPTITDIIKKALEGTSLANGFEKAVDMAASGSPRADRALGSMMRRRQTANSGDGR